jgi:hypothetical protein
MTAINRNATVIAFTVESTEGTPTEPASATDGYLRAQRSFDIAPAIEEGENQELTGGIGRAKSVILGETPTFNFQHNLRNSGTMGTAPNYAPLLKAAFGTQTAIGTERNTAGSSTTAIVKADTGQGSEFHRGQALLVQHASNPWEIRPVHSISTDDLTLGFLLDNAPGTNVNLGKAVTWSPANSGHQSLTGRAYLGNGPALEMVSGLKVTEFSFEATAREILVASFAMEGMKYYLNPIKIAAADTKLDFYDGSTDFAATITAGTYETPHDLADAIENAMNLADTGNTYTVTYSDTTGKFTIATDGATLSLKWSTGSNTANTIGDKIGFTVSADDTGALTYTSDTAQSWAAPHTPTYDSADPLVARDGQIYLGDADDNVTLHPSSLSFTLANTKATPGDIASSTGRGASAITDREVSGELTLLLDQYDAQKVYRMKQNTETRLCYINGTKSGGNWVKGTNIMLYLPSITITSFDTDDVDGYVGVTVGFRAFVDSSGNGEAYLSMV